VRNDTKLPQCYYDVNMNAHTLLPGETKEILADVAVMENILKSVPPVGKYLVKNIYVDPKTGKMILEYENPNL